MAFEEKLGEAYVELTTRGSVQPQLEREKQAARSAAQEFRRTSAAAQGLSGDPNAAFKKAAFESIMKSAADINERQAKKTLRAKEDEEKQARRLAKEMEKVNVGWAATANRLLGFGSMALGGAAGFLGSMAAVHGRALSNVQMSNPMLAFQSEQATRDMGGALGRLEEPFVSRMTAERRRVADALVTHRRELQKMFGPTGAAVFGELQNMLSYIPGFGSLVRGGVPGASVGAGITPGLGQAITPDQMYRELQEAVSQTSVLPSDTGDAADSLQRSATALEGILSALGGGTASGFAVRKAID